MDAKIRARVLLAALSLFSQLSPGVWIRLFIVVSESAIQNYRREVEFRREEPSLPAPPHRWARGKGKGMAFYEECMNHADECVRLASRTDDIIVPDQIVRLARGWLGNANHARDAHVIEFPRASSRFQRAKRP